MRPLIARAFGTVAVIVLPLANLAACGGSPSSTDSASSDLAFVRCMRAHGIADMPGPGPQDKTLLRKHPDLNPDNPEFKAALRSCQPDSEAVSPSTNSLPNTTTAATADCDSLTTCYSPSQFQEAYGILPLLKRGIDGRGITVVLPELAEPQFALPSSDIRRDLDQFDRLFHLPTAQLKSVTQLAPSASAWLANGEEVLDTEMVHAVAPAAKIVELLVSATSLNSATAGAQTSVAALRLGSSLGNVISISAAGQTGGEHCDSPRQAAALHRALQAATARHVTVVAASGDIGAVGEPCHLIAGLIGGTLTHLKEVNLPAADPLVLSAGGTTLTARTGNGGYVSESTWGLPYGDADSHFQASGGGLSKSIASPGYQSHVTGIGAYRGVPDVAADAAPHTGMAIVTSTTGGGYRIQGSGGTSASAPMWAGVIALADQYAGHNLGFVNAAVYRIGRGALYGRAFHDVTSGNNSASFPPSSVSGYQAEPGWDPATGWGSPNASVLVPLLARSVDPNDARGI